MTNEHVVDDNTTMQIYPSTSGGLYTGEVIGVDELRDLAVVSICCNAGLRALELSVADEVRLGAEVVAFGYPYRANVLSGLSVSEGIISSVEYNRQRDSYLVQTDAAINPGNSGGPLVNKLGKVVGTVASKVERTPGGRPIDNIGFAVASGTIRDRLSALESGAGREPTPTPTITPPPTPIPTPFPQTPVPDDWDLVLAAVGDSDQRVLDATKRKVVADWSGISVVDVPDVEAGYRLVSSGNEERNEVYLRNSGDLSITFAKITSSFTGYKPLLISSPIKFYGRVCRGGEDCDQTVFRELSDFVFLDEDVSSGRSDLAPWMRITALVPSDYEIRIEMVAYYTTSQ